MTPNDVANEIGAAIARVIGPDAVPGPTLSACAEVNAADFERCRLAAMAAVVGFDPIAEFGQCAAVKVCGVLTRCNKNLGVNEIRIMVHSPEEV